MHNAATTLFSKVEKRGQSPLLAENQFITNPIYAMNNTPGKHDKGGGCGVNVNCSQVNTNITDRMEENHNSTSNRHRSFTTHSASRDAPGPYFAVDKTVKKVVDYPYQYLRPSICVGSLVKV